MTKISSTDLDVFPVDLGGNVFGWTVNEAESFTNEGLSSLPYLALAKGFLTGKYRPNSKVQSARAESARAYLTEKGLRVLAALDEVCRGANRSCRFSCSRMASRPTDSGSSNRKRTNAESACRDHAVGRDPFECRSTPKA